MSNRKDLLRSIGDIEKPHETVADSLGDGPGREPLTVRLGDSWGDLARVPDVQRDRDASPRSPSALPLLDDMKGILQWD